MKSTRQITHTMEMVSTTKIMKALQRASDAGPYKDAIKRMLENLAAQPTQGTDPLLEVHQTCKRAIIIVVASNRGLAGGFNVQVERAALRHAKQLQANGVEVEFIACGKKPIEFFNQERIEPVLSFDAPAPSVAQANQIAAYCMNSYVSGTANYVEIWYQHAKSRMEQTLTVEQLLPVKEDIALPNAPRAAEATQLINTNREAKEFPDFAFEPSAEAVLKELIPAYIRTVIYHALIDSEAAEHGARRLAMQAATRNADDIITRLSREYNRLRQSSITTELSEIVGGANALEQEEA